MLVYTKNKQSYAHTGYMSYVSFEHPKHGHFVPPFWIWTSASSNQPGNMLIGLFDHKNIWFDTKKSILRCTVPEILDLESWWRPSWKMAPCANCTHFWRCRHAVSWPIHLNDWF